MIRRRWFWNTSCIVLFSSLLRTHFWFPPSPFIPMENILLVDEQFLRITRMSIHVFSVESLALHFACMSKFKLYSRMNPRLFSHSLRPYDATKWDKHRLREGLASGHSSKCLLPKLRAIYSYLKQSKQPPIIQSQSSIFILSRCSANSSDNHPEMCITWRCSCMCNDKIKLKKVMMSVLIWYRCNEHTWSSFRTLISLSSRTSLKKPYCAFWVFYFMWGIIGFCVCKKAKSPNSLKREFTPRSASIGLCLTM